MPAVSEKQRRFMAAMLARKRGGKDVKTGTSDKKLPAYAHKAGPRRKP